MNASYEESKHSRTRPWFGVDVFVYSYSQIRPSRHHEPSACHDDSCTSNVYVFLEAWSGKSSTKKSVSNKWCTVQTLLNTFKCPVFYRTAPKEAVAMQAQLILMMPTMKQSIHRFISGITRSKNIARIILVSGQENRLPGFTFITNAWVNAHSFWAAVMRPHPTPAKSSRMKNAPKIQKGKK